MDDPHPDGLERQGAEVLSDLGQVQQEVAALVESSAQWHTEALAQRVRADTLEERAASAEQQRLALESELTAAQQELRSIQETVKEQKEREAQVHEQLRLLYRLDLAQPLDPENIYERILFASIQIVGAERGVYLEADADPLILARYRFDNAHSDSPLLNALVKRIRKHPEVLILNDRAAIAELAADPLAKSIRNLACYPIVIKERLNGVVVVADKQFGPFSTEDSNLLLGVGNHALVALENCRLKQAVDDAYMGILSLICDAIEAKDAYTHGHCEEVSLFALALTRKLELTPVEQDHVFKSGMLHDVGKIAISDGILLKPGALLPAERAVIETHAVIGAELIENVSRLLPLVEIIRYHHERYDGKGYPEQLAGDAIPILARILAVADVYSTMLADRPYRPALTRARARQELIDGSGTQFDPNLVKLFLEILDSDTSLPAVRHTPPPRKKRGTSDS